MALGLLLASCGKQSTPTAGPGENLDLPNAIVFNEHIRPILSKNCMACHGGVKKSGGLSYVFKEEAIAQGQSGNWSIVPGKPDESYLIHKVSSKDPKIRMPPPEHGNALSAREIALLRQWISEGAHWQEHWAFKPPQQPAVPEIADDTFSRNDVDRFILARLKAEGLSPNAPASKGTLLRRVSLDLTGVPPSAEELAAFLADQSANAYETVVDRLLASSRYGERWATLWLDLARYADSVGMGQDAPRTIWKYRDWVIRAFNEDLPFDAFTIKQIAGDLLPDATLDDYLATAFHRNTQAQQEGGTNDEEFRMQAVLDRVNTTWQTWHGTTFGCVQCHSHPYDPFRHEEYYTFKAFLNSTMDSDIHGTEHPVMAFPVDADQHAQANALIAPVRTLSRALWQQEADAVQATRWTYLSGMAISTSRDAQMTYNIEQRNGHEEFVFEGTPANITQTIEAPCPPLDAPVQAIRLDVSPFDLEAAPYAASPGYKLEQFTLAVLPADGSKRRTLAFDQVFIDEPFPFFTPSPKGNPGISAFSQMNRSRWSVFRLKEPYTAAAGDRLQVVMKHGRTQAQHLMLIRRGALAISADTTLRQLDQNASRSEQRKQLDRARKALNVGKTVSIPIMTEFEPHLARGTKVFVRGNWTDLGKAVEPGVPASLHPLPKTDEPARLRAARWLVDKQNPIAARVLVCRFWEQLFGIGLVETLEDFGSIGEPPSHPQLLDHLALKLMHEWNWSMKSLLRELVTSAAYRQDAQAPPERIKRDPKNRLLARGPRNRMTGEMLRDQFLALAGLLNDTMYGKPIKPVLPEGGWSPDHPVAGGWTPSEKQERYRRSIYLHWQRSSIYPVLEAFDAPSRMLCSDRRMTSNTPVQPLFTLNDPALYEATQAFAKRMQAFAGTLEERIAYGYRLATCESPDAETVRELASLHQQVAALYPAEEADIQERFNAAVNQDLQQQKNKIAQQRRNILARAKKQKKDPPPEHKLPNPNSVVKGPEHAYTYSAEQAGYDSVAAVMLNLDRVLTK